MACRLCETRKPRRFCSGVQGDICTQCCGEQREETIACPLDCEYLIESRRHTAPAVPDASKLPNQDIKVSQEFLAEHAPLVDWIAGGLFDAALSVDGANDFDVREALDALIRTYRTLASGVYYETTPANPIAASIAKHIQAVVAEFRRQEQQASGMAKTRDGDVLRTLVFLQWMELDSNNGRKRGRAFLSAIARIFENRRAAVPVEAAPQSSLLLP